MSDCLNSRLRTIEESVTDLEGNSIEIIQSEQKLGKHEQCLCDLCENIKESNICVIGMLEGENRGKREEKYLKK